MERRDLLKGMAASAGAVTAATAVQGLTASQRMRNGGWPPRWQCGGAGQTSGSDGVHTPSICRKNGIGHRICQRHGGGCGQKVVARGANLVCVDWIKDVGEASNAEIVAAGGKSVFIHGDVADAAVMKEAVERAVRTFGALDAALNITDCP